jgi:16S rRNA (guanine527-N7)-methyltransferase
MLIEANNKMNLVGKSTINQIWSRHILDCFQVIDYIDENDKTMVDLGSGAGLPGLILAIAANERKISLKINLVEKSLKKTKFLKRVIDNLNLNVQIESKNIFGEENKIDSDVIVARAFKPLPVILQLIHNKAIKWKKIFVFLGKTGNKEVLQASKSWDIKYKQRMSITSTDSFIIEVNKLRKKN